jgi:hypothetical protein
MVAHLFGEINFLGFAVGFDLNQAAAGAIV